MSVPTTFDTGLVAIHAAPSDYLSRIDTLLSEMALISAAHRWRPLTGYAVHTLDQTTRSLLFSLDFTFDASVVDATRIASELAGIQRIWFEVSTPPNEDDLGQRFAFTPVLGIFHSQLDQGGNQVFGENQLLAAISASTFRPADELRLALESLLGVAWDQQLEPLRRANLESCYLEELAS